MKKLVQCRVGLVNGGRDERVTDYEPSVDKHGQHQRFFIGLPVTAHVIQGD